MTEVNITAFLFKTTCRIKQEDFKFLFSAPTCLLFKGIKPSRKAKSQISPFTHLKKASK